MWKRRNALAKTDTAFTKEGKEFAVSAKEAMRD